MTDKKRQIINLWRTCFGDPEPFIDLYFSRVYKDENALTLEKNGHIVSALQILPYTMTLNGTVVPVAYVGGVCTDPKERGKGYMRQLMWEAMKEMKRRGFALTALIPAESWLFDYYRQFGYAEVFRYSPTDYSDSSLKSLQPITVVPSTELEDKDLYVYMDTKLRERPACVLHSFDDFITIRKDFQLAGGDVFAALDEKQQIMGMAFAFPMEGVLIVKECLFDSEEIEFSLIRELKPILNCTKAKGMRPADAGQGLPKRMACILDEERLAKLWLPQHPKSLLPENAYMSLMLD